jgi:hypothetical protein
MAGTCCASSRRCWPKKASQGRRGWRARRRSTCPTCRPRNAPPSGPSSARTSRCSPRPATPASWPPRCGKSPRPSRPAIPPPPQSYWRTGWCPSPRTTPSRPSAGAPGWLWGCWMTGCPGATPPHPLSSPRLLPRPRAHSPAAALPHRGRRRRRDRLIDGFRAAATLRRHDPNAFDLLTTTMVMFRPLRRQVRAPHRPADHRRGPGRRIGELRINQRAMATPMLPARRALTDAAGRDATHVGLLTPTSTA